MSVALKFSCFKCGEEIIVRFLKPGEIAKCRKCGAAAAVPCDAAEVPAGQAEVYLNALLSSADRVVVGSEAAAVEAASQVNWLWGAIVLAVLASVPSLGAVFALIISLGLLKTCNKSYAVGLDIKNLFTVRPFKRMGAALAAGAAADLAVTTAFMVLMSKFYPDPSGSETIEKAWAGNHNWFFVFFSTTLYASCEEIFLRGLVFSYVKKHAGVLKALLLSSFLFSLLHVGNPWLSLVTIFVNGLIYCVAFEKTNSLAVPCLLHGLHNSALRTILILNELL
jgi:hypothetical protein